jgi:hypothetical protein
MKCRAQSYKNAKSGFGLHHRGCRGPSARINELSAWLPDQWKLTQAARLKNLETPAAPTEQNLWFT